MELVSIERPEDIVEGDVIVAKYRDKAYTALVNTITPETNREPWLFDCEPVTEVLTVNGKQTIKHHDKMRITYWGADQEESLPQVVYAVR